MRKLERKNISKREMILTFTGSGCVCTLVCNCPTYPTHQIGIGVREQGLDSATAKT